MTDLRRAALAFSLPIGCAAMFTGCSNNVNQASAPVPAVRAPSAGSWIDRSDPATVFVSSPSGGAVYGFSQKTGNMTEEIANLPGPKELASDSQGNLYVSIPLDWSVLVYPPGMTTPMLTLTGAGPNAAGIAVSRKGEVAVVSYTGAQSSVVFFSKGKKRPFSTIALPYKIYPEFDAYDSQGNLWVDSEYNLTVTMTEIVGGGHGRQISQFVLSPSVLPESGGIEIDKSDHLLVNAEAVENSSDVLAIFQYQLPNPSQPTATILMPTGDYSGPRGVALTSNEKSIYAVEYENTPTVVRMPYPAGGSEDQTISVTGAEGIAVTPWAKP